MAATNPLTKGIPPIHPGAYLKDTIIPALEISAVEFAKHIGIGRRTLYHLMDEDTGINAALALRLAKATGVRAEMWMNLQQVYDLKRAEAELADELAGIEKLKLRPIRADGAASAPS